MAEIFHMMEWALRNCIGCSSSQSIVWAEICTIIRIVWYSANGPLINQVCYFEKTGIKLKMG